MTIASKFPNSVKNGLISFQAPSKRKGKIRRFSDQQVKEIKALRKSGMLQRDIALQFGCAESTMSYLLAGRK